MTFAVNRATFRPGDSIEGVATLRLIAPGPGALSGSGSGLVGFAFHEVGGEGRGMDPAATSDCAPYHISIDMPITFAIVKSGGVSGDEPDAAFKRAFLDGPIVRLPAGTWDITARASFTDGAACEGPSIDIPATVRVVVSD
jgi:hypothetical protein